MVETGKSWEIYKRLLAFAKPYRLWIFLGFFGMAVEAAAGAGILRLTKPMIDEMLVNRVFSYWVPASLVAFLFIRGLGGLIGDYAIVRSGRNVVRDLRMRLMRKYLNLPGQAFDRENVPTMITRLSGDTEMVAQAAVDALKVIVSNVLSIIAYVSVMFWTSWRVSLVLFVLAPVMGWTMGKVGKRYRLLNTQIQKSNADLLQSADQALRAHQEVKTYGAQAAEMDRYGTQTKHNVNLALKVQVTNGLLSMFVQVFGAVGVAVMLIIAGHEALNGRLTAGDFFALLTAMISIVPLLRQLTNVQSMLERGIDSASRVFTVLDAPEEKDTGTRPLARSRGLLEFRNVGVRYDGQQRDALTAISFTARPGTVTAIVGRSGSGKSTLVKLIPRFYEVDSGEILLDGHSISEYPLADLRRQVAMVSQQVTLFDGSIAQNIAYGEMGDADDARIAAAIRDANAAEFVDRMPEGAQSDVGERGSKLSGGQRQRIAIARAMLKDAPILVLDEATAALDNESERLVQQALDRLMPDRTTLVIAHRLSTVEHADQVLVLDEGEIVEQGTHAELIANDGVYAHLHRMQFREGKLR
ncbi:lipid A export permease/ATP-binding protein MsbA [Lysobacter sp. HDW10]|uniref:lipid A export permease/ATP-binding protein MsbA n=1 Tax=Lysobacter sp. HDW10 TaxID=2714936 RepID=UPI00140AD8C1|nr:lipid A export permease/ATP-binding protein MsbA [Lysobacter sp. HDW10]QIK81875.1 lipid A export permease/ATP-binding protein MsbA [Lysobacter sp. HDW10]